ncbi:MAG: leucine-rich repeat domain-containing protein [Bacteroidales bacterium]|nr:leucine-rich repeat domain-containing protein [Bacteroidales bacterium]
MNQSIQFIKAWLYRSLLFAVMLCFSSLSYAQVDVPKLVDGYYELKTPAHLKLFSSSVNAGLQTINARLVADIDMSAEGEFVPIGTYGKGYRGYFDGNGHSIKGLKLPAQNYSGLFGYMDGGRVSNLTLQSPVLYLDNTTVHYAGLVCGHLSKGSGVVHGVIENCHVRDGILAEAGAEYFNWGDDHGGICGKADVAAEVIGCTFSGKIYGDDYLGGIVGELNSGAQIRDCTVLTGTKIIAHEYAGGIVGYIGEIGSKVINCSVQTGCTITGTPNGTIYGYNGGQVSSAAYTVQGLNYATTGDVQRAETGSSWCTEMKVTGIADATLRDYTIYTDIGATYSYFTSDLVAYAFSSKPQVRSLTFADCNKGSQAYKWINMRIADNAFRSCHGMEALYMKYTVTSGTDHTVMLDPTDVYPTGTAAFYDCPNLKVYVDADKVEAFKSDARWSAYADRIVGTTAMRVADFANSGVNYARNHRKNPTADYSIEVHNGVNVYPVHVIGPTSDLGSSYDGIATIYNDPGATYAYRTTKIWAEAYRNRPQLRIVRFFTAKSGTVYAPLSMEIGSRAFADCPGLQYIDLVYGNTYTSEYEKLTPTQIYPTDDTMLEGSPDALIRVWPDQVEAFKADARWGKYADRIVAWSKEGKEYISDGLTYSTFAADASSSSLTVDELNSQTAGHNAILRARLMQNADDFVSLTSEMVDRCINGESDTRTFYTHVTNVSADYLASNGGSVTLYNDIGATYKYRTVLIDAGAFRNNTNLRRLTFGDINTAGKAYDDLQLIIEKGAFKGCTNLRMIDLGYRKYTGTNTIVYLTPSQIVPAKDLFDEDSQVIIRIGEGTKEQFLADPNWAQYADRLVEYNESADYYDVGGLRYSVLTDSEGNRLTITGDDDYTIYVTHVTEDVSNGKTKDFVILNDIGSDRRYATRKIGVRVFDESAIETLSFADCDAGVKAYKWLGVEIADEAFYNCKSLKAIFMKYTMYSGINHTVMLDPTDVYPTGERAFVGCDSLLIYVDYDKYDAFVNDEHWKPYSHLIVPTTAMRTSEFTKGGAAYTRVNAKDGSGSYRIEKGKGDVNVYLTQITGPAADLTTSYYGALTIYNDPGVTYAYRTTRIQANAFDGCDQLVNVRLLGASSGTVYSDVNMTLGSGAFANCPALRYIDLVYGNTNTNTYEALSPDAVTPDDETLISGSDYAYIRVWPDLVDAFKSHPKWSAYRERIIAWSPVGREYVGQNGVTYEGYTVRGTDGNYSMDNEDMCSGKEGHNAKLMEQLKKHAEDYVKVDWEQFKDTVYNNYYYTHVTAVDQNYLMDGNRTITIYNDIGRYYNYRTVCIDSTAFQGNELVTAIDFGDVNTNVGSAHLPLKLLIQRGAFKGCRNLLSINMIYHKYTGTNDIEYLRPEQVIPAKELFDSTQHVFICVSPELVNAYKADPNWAQYKSQIVPYVKSYDTYTDLGVVYEYFPVLMDSDGEAQYNRTYYSNKRNADFRSDYLWLKKGYGEFEWSDILTDDDYGEKVMEVTYAQITAADTTYLKNNDGHLRIINDIGLSNVYKTIAVSPMAFRGNEYIEWIDFTDLSYEPRANNYTEIGILLPDSVFAGCKNLKHIDMVQYVTVGVPNHYVALSPKQVIVGEHAFDGCHEDFEIRVTGEMYPQFINDPNWAKYRDRIVIFEYTPDGNDNSYTVEGVTYSPASHLLNNLPTEQKAYMAWSLWNLPVQIVKTAVIAALSTATAGAFGVVWEGASFSTLGHLVASNIANFSIAQFCTNLAAGATTTATSIIFSQMGMGYLGSIVNMAVSFGASGIANGINSGIQGVTHKVIDRVLISKMAEAGLKTGLEQGLTSGGAALAIPGLTNAATALQLTMNSGDPIELETYSQDESADLIGKMDAGGGSFGSWLSGTTQERKVDGIYHMYVKDVDDKTIEANDGELIFYNDIGTYWHYRTVAMTNDAARGKQSIRSIRFKDCYGERINNQTTFEMVVPDSAFMGCTNLSDIYMFMDCTEGTNTTQALGPENFILHGFNVFKDCPNLKIHVAPDRYEEFVNDTIWKQYAIVVDNTYEEPTCHNVAGIYYGYNFKKGSLWDYGTINDKTHYNVHVVKPEQDYINSHNGECVILTNSGVVYNYNTTYVKRKAFEGCAPLKTVKFRTSWGDYHGRCYTTPQYELRDSAFANCPELESFYLFYDARNSNYETSQSKFVSFDPAQITLGKDVFAGSPKVKLKMHYDMLGKYIADPSWNKYMALFSPTLTCFKDKQIQQIFSSDELEVIEGYKDETSPWFEAKLDDKYLDTDEPYNRHFDKLKNNTEIYYFDEFKCWEALELRKVWPAMFSGASNLRSIKLPASITEIGDEAFRGCTNLVSITLPDTVCHIGARAFKESGVQRFYVGNPVPAELGEEAFASSFADYVIYVPKENLDAYLQAWSQYRDHIRAYDEAGEYITVYTNDETDVLDKKLGLEFTPDLSVASILYYGELQYGLTNIKGSFQHIKGLKVVGTIGLLDAALVNTLANYGLEELDLSETKANSDLMAPWWEPIHRKDWASQSQKTKVSGEEGYIDQIGLFSESHTLKKVILPEPEDSSDEPFIDGCDFAYCDKLETVIFTKPTDKWDDRIFYAIQLKNLVSLPSEYFDYENVLKDCQVKTLYCPSSVNAQFAIKSESLFREVLSPYKDDEVFRILAMHDAFSYDRLGTVTSTKDWFRGSNIKNFDEFYIAIQDTVLADYCFADCKQLETISLPTNLVYLDNTAFKGCTSLREINVFGVEPAQLESENVFDDLPSDYRIRVLSEKVDDYVKAWPEKVARHIISFANDGKMTEIVMSKAGVLADSLGLSLSSNKMVVIGGDLSKHKKVKVSGPVNHYDLNTLAAMAGQVRDFEEKLEYKILHPAQKFLPEYTQDREEIWGNKLMEDVCASNAALIYIDLSDAYLVNEQGERQENFRMMRNQFQNCDRLKTIILPRSADKLPIDAFSYCDRLTDVVLGEKSTWLRFRSLTNCPRLKSVTTLSDRLTIEQYNGNENYAPFDKTFTLDTLFCARDNYQALAGNAMVQRYVKNVIPAYDDHGLMRILAPRGYTTQEHLARLESFNNLFHGDADVKDLRALSRSYRVKSIADGTFADMKSLRYAALPDSVLTLGKALYSGCDSLQYIDWHNCKSMPLVNIDRSNEKSPFYGMNRRTLIYVPLAAATYNLDENVVNTAADGLWQAMSYYADDRQTVEVPYPFTTQRAEINRVFMPNVKSTVYLPFSIDEASAAALGKFYAFDGYESETGDVYFKRVYSTEAGKAYLFKPAADHLVAEGDLQVCVTEYSGGTADGMYGTWERKVWTEDPGNIYGYAATAGDGGESAGRFVRVGAGASVSPMRAWLRLMTYGTGAQPAQLSARFDDEMPDNASGSHIANPNPLSADTPVDVYGIDGRLVRRSVPFGSSLVGLPDGIFIVNGQKIIINN